MIENGDNKNKNDDVTKALDTWTYKSKNTLMYVPEGVPLTPDEELIKSKKVRAINHTNTRFNPDLLKTINQSPQTPSSLTATQKLNNPTLNALSKIGVDGKEANSQETPSIKGYKLLDPSPSPMPGRLNGDESPMMVWGEIESTPFRLDPSSTPYSGRMTGGPEFKIPDVPEREKLALSLEEQANAARRKKKNEALKQVQRNLASPGSSPYMSDKINNMSPAAQRLLSSKIGLKGDKSSSSPFSSKQAATPSPRSTKSSLNSPYLGLASPSHKSGSGSSTLGNLRSNIKRQSNESSLTDNLLKLPKNS